MIDFRLECFPAEGMSAVGSRNVYSTQLFTTHDDSGVFRERGISIPNVFVSTHLLTFVPSPVVRDGFDKIPERVNELNGIFE